MWTIGRLATQPSGGQAVTIALWACMAAALAIVLLRSRDRRQEPAVFFSATYISLGIVLAVAQAIAGRHTETIAIVLTLPLLPALATGDQRTRRWINRIAGHTGR